MGERGRDERRIPFDLHLVLLLLLTSPLVCLKERTPSLIKTIILYRQSMKASFFFSFTSPSSIQPSVTSPSPDDGGSAAAAS